VFRGGSFFNRQWDARCALRVGYSPDTRGIGLGFRVVVSPFNPETG
jgi:formylglycine-generating enzyme required for sulfatase activity